MQRGIESHVGASARPRNQESLVSAFARPRNHSGDGIGGGHDEIDYEAMDDADRFAARERARVEAELEQATRRPDGMLLTQPVTPSERSMTRTGGASAAYLSTPGDVSEFIASARGLLPGQCDSHC